MRPITVVRRNIKKLTRNTELILAVNSRQTSEMVHEATDLLFHYLVLLEKVNISLEEVVDELLSREGVSGLRRNEKEREKLVIYLNGKTWQRKLFFGSK